MPNFYRQIRHSQSKKTSSFSALNQKNDESITISQFFVSTCTHNIVSFTLFFKRAFLTKPINDMSISIAVVCSFFTEIFSFFCHCRNFLKVIVHRFNAQFQSSDSNQMNDIFAIRKKFVIRNIRHIVNENRQ